MPVLEVNKNFLAIKGTKLRVIIMKFPCDVFNLKERDTSQIPIIVSQEYNLWAQDTSSF